MENNNQILEEENNTPRTEQELQKEAIEAIEIQEKVISVRQKVSLGFAIPALATTFYGLLSRNPYVTISGGVPAIVSTWACADTVSELIKLDEAKALILDSRYEEFIEEARTGRQVPVLLSIADVLEEELFDPPEPLPESDEPDYFDDDDYFSF